MNLETTMTLVDFERSLSRSSISGIASPIPAAPLMMFQDRIYVGASVVVAVCVGLMLRRALRRLRTHTQAAFALIEWSFYLVAADLLSGFVYFCWTNPEVLASAVGIAFVAINLVIGSCFLWYVWGIVNHFKNAMVSS